MQTRQSLRIRQRKLWNYAHREVLVRLRPSAKLRCDIRHVRSTLLPLVRTLARR